MLHAMIGEHVIQQLGYALVMMDSQEFIVKLMVSTMEGTLPSGTLPLSTLDKGYPLSYSLIPLGFRLKPYPTQKQSLATG